MLKRILQGLLLMGMLMTLFSVSALAEEPAVAGMYAIEKREGVTLTPQGADGTEVSGGAQGGYSNYYADAVRFQMEATGLTANAQYLLLVVQGETGTAPTEDNIVFIDQAAADASGKATFAAYPGSLMKAHYCVYLTGTERAYGDAALAAEFDHYLPYTLGDVNGDGSILPDDALFVLQMSVGLGTWTDTQKLAADVNKDGAVLPDDALFILQKSVGLPTVF